jgi:hypothetical protein
LKKATVFLAAAAATACLAATANIDFRPKADTSWAHDVVASFVIEGGITADLTARNTTKVEKSDANEVKLRTQWSNLAVKILGDEAPMEAEDQVLVLNKDLVPSSIAGGVVGAHPAQWQLATTFIPPTGPLEIGKKYLVNASATENVPAFRYEGTYVGKETVETRELHRFDAKLQLSEGTKMQADIKTWVTGEGRVYKLESKFKDMDIPAAGMNASGTAKLNPAK